MAHAARWKGGPTTIVLRTRSRAPSSFGPVVGSSAACGLGSGRPGDIAGLPPLPSDIARRCRPAPEEAHARGRDDFL